MIHVTWKMVKVRAYINNGRHQSGLSGPGRISVILYEPTVWGYLIYYKYENSWIIRRLSWFVIQHFSSKYKNIYSVVCWIKWTSFHHWCPTILCCYECHILFWREICHLETKYMPNFGTVSQRNFSGKWIFSPRFAPHGYA